MADGSINSDSDRPEKEALSVLTIQALTALLKEKGLKRTGTKDALVNRLYGKWFNTRSDTSSSRHCRSVRTKPVYCCVPECHNHSHTQGVSLHRIPMGQKRSCTRMIWLQELRKVRKNLIATKGTRVCSGHFTCNDYTNQILNSGAVPSIFPPQPETEKSGKKYLPVATNKVKKISGKPVRITNGVVVNAASAAMKGLCSCNKMTDLSGGALLFYCHKCSYQLPEGIGCSTDPLGINIPEEPKINIKSEPDMNMNSESTVMTGELRTSITPEIIMNIVPDMKSEPDFNVKSEPEINMGSKPDFNVKSEPNFNVESEPDFNWKSEPDFNVKSELDYILKSEPDINTESESGSINESDLDINIKTESDVKIETELNLKFTCIPDMSMCSIPDAIIKSEHNVNVLE